MDLFCFLFRNFRIGYPLSRLDGPMITTITRRYKHEAEQAVSDLLARGWTITYDLTEIRNHGTTRGSYDYRKSRYTSVSGMVASCWVCKLEKEKSK